MKPTDVSRHRHARRNVSESRHMQVNLPATARARVLLINDCLCSGWLRYSRRYSLRRPRRLRRLLVGISVCNWCSDGRSRKKCDKCDGEMHCDCG